MKHVWQESIDRFSRLPTEYLIQWRDAHVNDVMRNYEQNMADLARIEFVGTHVAVHMCHGVSIVRPVEHLLKLWQADCFAAYPETAKRARDTALKFRRLADRLDKFAREIEAE